MENSATPPQVITPDSGPNITDIPPPPSPKTPQSKKKLLLVGVLLLVVFGAAGAYFLTKDSSPKQNTAQKKHTPITAAAGTFYMSKSQNEIMTYRPDTKKLASTKLSLGAHRKLLAGDTFSNQPAVFDRAGE